jgi:parallel beta-helix repeat protein
MTGTVTAEYLTYAGAPAKGTVTFGTNTTDQQLRDPDGNVVYTGPRKYRLVAGALEVDLPGTDDVAFAETGWQYWARIELDGAPPALRWFELPDGDTVDLADIAGELAPGDPLTHPLSYADVVADIQDPESVIGEALSASIAASQGLPIIDVSQVTTGTLDDTGVADSGARWQAALDEAETAGGARIVCPPGTYLVKNLTVPSFTILDLAGVTLQYGGAHGTAPTLESVPVILSIAGTVGTHVTDVIVRNGTFLGNRTGSDFTTGNPGDADLIQCHYADRVTIEDNLFQDATQDAVVVAEATGSIIRRNAFVDVCDAAMELRSGTGYQLLDNRATRVRDFVAAKPDTTDVTIAGNVATVFGYAVAYPARQWVIRGNRFSATTAPGGIDGAATGHGIFVTRHPSLTATTNEISDILIEGNDLSGWSGSNTRGVYILDDNGQTLKRITVRGNTISGCYSAIHTEGETLIDSNTITVTRRAVYVLGAGCQVNGNRIIVTGDAGGQPVEVTADGVTISNNQFNVTGHTGSATITLSGNKGTISGNTITAATSTAQGIASSGDDNIITGNVCLGHNHGIRVTGTADRNVVTGNNCRDAQFNGVQIQSGATKTLVVGNMLLNNNASASSGVPLSDAGTSTTAANNVTS